MLNHKQVKEQAFETIEDALDKIWCVSMFLYSHKERDKVLEAWNLVFDVKEALEAELEESGVDRKEEDKVIYDKETRMIINKLKRAIEQYNIIKREGR